MDCGTAQNIESSLPLGTRPLVIADAVTYDINDFSVPRNYCKFIESVLIPHGMVVDRLEKLAADIYDFYQGKELHMLCVLKGSRAVFTELFRALGEIHRFKGNSTIPAYFEHYLRIKSYQDTSSTSNFQLISEDLSHLKDKHILIVEDIVDTGQTVTRLCSWLKETIQPKDVGICALLTKRVGGIRSDLPKVFCGFSIPNVYVIGFSLDVNDWFRDLKHICVFKQSSMDELAVLQKSQRTGQQAS